MLFGISSCQPHVPAGPGLADLFPPSEVLNHHSTGDDGLPMAADTPESPDSGSNGPAGLGGPVEPGGPADPGDLGDPGDPAGSADPAGPGVSGGLSALPPQTTVEVLSVSINLDSTQVVKGALITPRILFQPSYATDQTYTLRVSDESVLQQMPEGLLAIGGGIAEITAIASNGVTARVNIAVIVPVETVSLSTEPISLAPGQSYELSPVIMPEDATDRNMRFTSSDERVATVSSSGVIMAVGGGTAVIECAVGGVSASVNVTVSIPVTSINLSTDKRSYTVGERGRLTVQLSPQDASNQAFTVSVSGGAELDGETSFTCTAGGQVTFTVTASNGVTARHTVNVLDISAFADEVFRLTNIERANAGLPALARMSSLTIAAQVRAAEAIAYWSHTRPDGRSCFTAFDEAGVRYRLAGENLAAGQRTPEEVVTAWMNSPGHRENILTGGFGHLGVGVAIDVNGRIYWAQAFTD